MRIALTFDAEHPDRPHSAPEVQDRLLEALADLGIRASFFLQGRWVEAYPETARRIARDGHAIGSHSHYHARMPILSEHGLRADVREAERAIVDAVGVEPRPWFRCPFGDGWDDPAVLGALSELGYRHVGWDLVAADWEPGPPPEALEQAVVEGVLARDGETVVLLHAWPERTLLALPAIVGRLGAEGATFVGVDELERVPSRAEL